MARKTQPNTTANEGPQRLRGRPRSLVAHDLIIKVAAELFDRNGYTETTMQDIAESLLVTKPTLYANIRGKQNILESIMEHWMNSADSVLDKMEQAAGEREKFRVLVNGWTRVAVENAKIFKVFLAEERDLSKNFMRDYKHWSDTAYKRILAVVTANQENGSFTDKLNPVVATFSVIAFFNFLPQWYSESGSLSPQAIAENFITMIEDGLRPRNTEQ